MKRRRCKNKNCRCLFVVSPQHPNQRYCAQKKCQRVRKTLWQREKIAQDEAYRKNKADSQERWAKKRPRYWKQYRKDNPDYTKQNREKQKERDLRKKDRRGSASIFKNLAKMDASNHENDIISGFYTLIPASCNNLAKMDALTVKIERISSGYG